MPRQQQEHGQLLPTPLRSNACAVHAATPLCPIRRRQLGHHVLYERAAWVNVVQLEVHLAHFLKGGLLQPLLALAPTGERVSHGPLAVGPGWAACRADAFLPVSIAACLAAIMAGRCTPSCRPLGSL